MDERDDELFLDDSGFEDEESSDSQFVEDEESEANDASNGDDDSDIESDSLSDDIGDLHIHSKGRIKDITQHEADEMKAELAEKMAALEVATKALNKAYEDGDIRENAAYEHYSEVTRGLQHDILALENELKSSRIVTSNAGNDVIRKGSRVHLTVTDFAGLMSPQDIMLEIVSEGHGGIPENSDIVRVPENSEVYRNMEDKSSGEFTLTGTDGNNYKYKFEIVR